MSRFIEVKDFSPPPGQEWSAGLYPGDGIYATQSGLMFVVGGQMNQIMLQGWQTLLKHRAEAEPAAPAGPAQFAQIDLHRLIDQILDHGKERAANAPLVR